MILRSTIEWHFPNPENTIREVYYSATYLLKFHRTSIELSEEKPSFCSSTESPETSGHHETHSTQNSGWLCCALASLHGRRGQRFSEKLKSHFPYFLLQRGLKVAQFPKSKMAPVGKWRSTETDMLVWVLKPSPTAQYPLALGDPHPCTQASPAPRNNIPR